MLNFTMNVTTTDDSVSVGTTPDAAVADAAQLHRETQQPIKLDITLCSDTDIFYGEDGNPVTTSIMLIY